MAAPDLALCPRRCDTAGDEGDDHILNASDIQRFRDTVATVLPGTAVLYENQTTSDGQGGQTNSFVASGTVDARLDYKGASFDNDVAGAQRNVQEYMLTVPHDTTLSEDWRVEMNGGTYEVTAVLTETPWDLCERVKLERIQ